MPLVLFSVKSNAVVSGKPFGSCSIVTLVIELSVISAKRTPLLIFSRVDGLTTVTAGASIKNLPPSVTLTKPTVLESLIVINGEISAVGCRVLSEEYSNPSLITLTVSALPIVLEVGTIYASLPSEPVTSVNTGYCS